MDKVNQSKKQINYNFHNPAPLKDKDIEREMKQDQHAAFARYRELVQARKEREKLRPREPEVYHRDIYNK
jgi:hypothetical protein